jgi:hypothetical protein
MLRVAAFFSRFGEAFEAAGRDWLFSSLSFVVMWLGFWKWKAWHQDEGLIAVGFIIAVNVITLVVAPTPAGKVDQLGRTGLESSGAEPKPERRRSSWRQMAERWRDRYRTVGLPGLLSGLALVALTIGLSNWFIREGLDVLMVILLPGAFCAALALLALGKRNGVTSR